MNTIKHIEEISAIVQLGHTNKGRQSSKTSKGNNVKSDRRILSSNAYKSNRSYSNQTVLMTASQFKHLMTKPQYIAS